MLMLDKLVYNFHSYHRASVRDTTEICYRKVCC